MKNLLKILFILLLIQNKIYTAEYIYILNDKCINDLWERASFEFKSSPINVLKDSRGIILRYEFEDPIQEFYNYNFEAYKKVEYFLAKIENPAIIEVHTETFPNKRFKNIKKWEISTIMANNIEAIITKPYGNIEQNRINSIGYGEFLPANTSNNGGKKANRVDIIILCNIGGE